MLLRKLSVRPRDRAIRIPYPARVARSHPQSKRTSWRRALVEMSFQMALRSPISDEISAPASYLRSRIPCEIPDLRSPRISDLRSQLADLRSHLRSPPANLSPTSRKNPPNSHHFSPCSSVNYPFNLAIAPCESPTLPGSHEAIRIRNGRPGAEPWPNGSFPFSRVTHAPTPKSGTPKVQVSLHPQAQFPILVPNTRSHAQVRQPKSASFPSPTGAVSHFRA